MQVSGKIGRWWPLLGGNADDESRLHVDIVLAPILDGAGAIPGKALPAAQDPRPRPTWQLE